MKWRIIREVANEEKKIVILNVRTFEIPYKLNYKQLLLLKNKIINKINNLTKKGKYFRGDFCEESIAPYKHKTIVKIVKYTIVLFVKFYSCM